LTLFYCPQCKRELAASSNGYICNDCHHFYPIIDGIPQFITSEIPQESFDAKAFDYLYQMEQKHFWHVGRREMLLDIIKAIPGSATVKILEIGCGNGSVLTYLKQNGLNMEGGDVFREGLQYCRRRAGEVPLYQIDVTALPFKENYDIAGLFDVIEHLDDDEKALKEVYQALKPGGTLIVTVPAHQFLWRRADKLARHKRRYSRKELIAKLERNGFTIRKVSYFITIFFPLFFALKTIDGLKRKNKPQEGSSLIEMKTYPGLNELFLWVLRLENRLIRHINLPTGASLMVVAEKPDA
jgi:SAM-dependent methyltransferase